MRALDTSQSAPSEKPRIRGEFVCELDLGLHRCVTQSQRNKTRERSAALRLSELELGSVDWGWGDSDTYLVFVFELGLGLCTGIGDFSFERELGNSLAPCWSEVSG